MIKQPADRGSAVLVLGEALVDVVSRGGEVTEHVGGSPANVAFGLGRLGHDVSLGTWIGRDRRGRRIAQTCRSAGVRLVAGSDAAPRTSVAHAAIDAHGQATYNFDLTWALPTVPDLDRAGHVHTGSIAATLEPGGSQVVEALRTAASTATISYDPNARPTLMGSPDRVRGRVAEIVAVADVVKASDEDIEWLYPGAEITDIMRSWLGLGAGLVVVTRGVDGASFLAGTLSEPTHLPGRSVLLADTVGAGDSFMAGLVSGLLDDGLLGGPETRRRLRGADAAALLPAIDRAVATSGITVRRPGAYAPTREELDGA